MRLEFTCSGEPILLEISRIVNAGYTGRNHKAVEKHICELAALGVSAPSSIPALYPITSDRITTGESIEVIGSRTSGEVEVVLLRSGGKLFVGVGSDHTDRALESHDVQLSKQVCPNVLSSTLWAYEDVRNHWDELVLSAWVWRAQNRILSQHGTLAQLLPSEELLRIVGNRAVEGKLDDVAIFSGTIPSLTGELVFGDRFEGELLDPTSGETLTCRYDIKPINWLAKLTE